MIRNCCFGPRTRGNKVWVIFGYSNGEKVMEEYFTDEPGDAEETIALMKSLNFDNMRLLYLGKGYVRV